MNADQVRLPAELPFTETQCQKCGCNTVNACAFCGAPLASVPPPAGLPPSSGGGK